MKVGDLVKANKFANWAARQAMIGFVLEVFDQPGAYDIKLTSIRVLLGGDIKLLPAAHFAVMK